MGCGGSKEAAHPEANGAHKDDKFIPQTTIDDTGIEDLDKVFKKVDVPLSDVIGINNGIQTAIEQLFAAGSALFGANLAEASLKDGKLSIEIFKPPQTKDEKKIVIAVVTGERTDKDPKDKGIEVKNDELYENMKKNEELLNHILDANEHITVFNAFMQKKEYKDMKLAVAQNRLKVDMEKPKDGAKGAIKELTKINMVQRHVNNFNHAFFPVKSGLAKQAFKEGLDLGKILNHVMNKLKEALKGMVPSVSVDMEGLMQGKLDFKITMPGAPDINTFIDTSDLIPPMLKKAWSHINGKGGFIDCMKDCASKLVGLMGHIKDAVLALKNLPHDKEQIKAEAKKAVTSKKISPFDVPKIPGKMKHNAEQLGRAPHVLEEFVENIKQTLKDFKDAMAGAAPAEENPVGGAITDTVGAVTEDLKEISKENAVAEDTKNILEEKPDEDAKVDPNSQGDLKIGAKIEATETETTATTSQNLDKEYGLNGMTVIQETVTSRPIAAVAELRELPNKDSGKCGACW